VSDGYIDSNIGVLSLEAKLGKALQISELLDDHKILNKIQW
jgi:hypothetical protein